MSEVMLETESRVMDVAGQIASEMGISVRSVQAVISLIEEGGTVPFIARYRKEATGFLDEVAILDIRDRSIRIAELNKRREAILASCAEQGVLSETLKSAFDNARTMVELEDLYLPYRPKRKTRASAAKEKGLNGLALHIMKQRKGPRGLLDEAANYVDPEKGVASAAEALSGARDIIAEAVSEHAGARQRIRQLFFRRSVILAVMPKKRPDGKDAGDAKEAGKYRDYCDSETNVFGAPSHRILALFRGERDGYLKLKIEPEESTALGILQSVFVRGSGEESDQLRLALQDSYKRLLAPSMETELRASLEEQADRDAIGVFAKNLHAILMASPFGSRRLLALDPGFKSGCKLVVLSEQGDLLHNETIYPHPPQNRSEEAAKRVSALAKEYRLETAAVGNGTAGRETDAWLRGLGFPLQVIMVNESGASVYSASETARSEFPDHDLTVRGAVSIGRRLQDPLAELVKIDPKSIGVGQYQHDVDQKKLKSSLDDVVVSCVNQVGVDLNNASRELLKYVAGLSQTIVDNIVKYRGANGAFSSRDELHKVPRLGPKTFEQCAGFLRIRDGRNPLDASAVHPENYELVSRMARDLGCTVRDLMTDDTLRARIVPEHYDGVGSATLQDILSELAKPGRDPRREFEVFSFDGSVHEPSDLKKGMTLPGLVSNITDFGAFVDIGVHLNGLIHKSKLKGSAAKGIMPGSAVFVEILDVDLERGRISLSLAEKV